MPVNFISIISSINNNFTLTKQQHLLLRNKG